MFHCKERTVFLTVVDVLNDQMTEQGVTVLLVGVV